MAVDGHDHALHRHVQAPRRRGDDAQVGLVRDQPVDRMAVEAMVREGLLDHGVQGLDRDLEHVVAAHHHLHAVVGLVLEAHRDPDRVVQQLLVRAVRVQVRGQDAGLVVGLEHHRAGAVAEQHAGAAVAPVDHARQGFGTHHQRALRGPAAHELVGDPQRVEETRAGRVDVEGGAAVGAQAVLQQARGAGEDDVGRGRAEHDQVDVGGDDAGGLHRAQRRLEGEVAGGLARQRDMALADAGARADPLVAGVDAPGELVVAEHVVGQVAAGAGDACVGHAPSRGPLTS